MKVLKRNPDVNWRVETHREEKALEVLEDPERQSEDNDIVSMGTVTILAGGVMHQLNILGGEIWQLCDGTLGREDITRKLLDTFEVDHHTLRIDLDKFVDEMLEKGLIHEE